ncbi:hypothetical protein QR680_005793 [Steinernema hermaphroditum]|uniref:DUF4536 domain-containing protein n=1 Tax=Steinernema hermaphroditum TaxID=289476 RepID=A0AA39HUP2_9BILA|nr:hypothetical protein QR680_005793 [Steinernema hermaphroditum]
MEAEPQQEQKSAKEPFSIFRVGQSASLIGATFLMLRGFNRFATQRQRLKAFASSAALLYTAASIEMGWFPFSFAVSERVILPNKKKTVEPVAEMVTVEEVEKKLKEDCQECRITGTLSTFAIASFVTYHTFGSYYKVHPRQQIAVRILAAGIYYVSLARWTYLPPFHHLKPS